MTGWKVTFTAKAVKQAARLPRREQDLLKGLVGDMKVSGPVQPRWRNYSRLGKHEHHCHLSYRWVACWKESVDELQLIEVYYAGSRENAPYG